MNINTEEAPLLGGATPSHSAIKNQLYISHSLYVWNARVFEFGFVLFLVDLFPNTLWPSSLFSLCSCLSGILGASKVASIVENGERLHIVRESIFIQRTAVLLPTVVLLTTHVFAHMNPGGEESPIKASHILTMKYLSLAFVICGGCIERLCQIANKISIARDWLVTIAAHDDKFLMELNVKLRGIDLFCKLVGPTFISLLAGVSIRYSMLFIIVMNIISNYLEYFSIKKVYQLVPALQIPKHKPDIINESASTSTSTSTCTNNTVSNNESHDNHGQFLQNVHTFTHSLMCLPTLAYAMLYLTVLSFGNQTIAFLLSFDDINSLTVGCLKAVSTIFELSATVITPKLVNSVGLVNTGMYSISSEFIFLCPILIGFVLNLPYRHWLLCLFVPLSRVGLWGYDLVIQNMVQLYITDDSQRSQFSAIEESLIGTFELSGYLMTLILHKPDMFEYPVFVSISSVGIGMIIFSIFVVKWKNGKMLLPN